MINFFRRKKQPEYRYSVELVYGDRTVTVSDAENVRPMLSRGWMLVSSEDEVRYFPTGNALGITVKRYIKED